MSRDPPLEKLKKKIQNVREEAGLSPLPKNKPPSPTGRFFNAGIDLVSGVFVGVGLGLFTDWAFGSSPWGLLIFFILGAAAGMLNMYRTVTVTKPEGKKKTHG